MTEAPTIVSTAMIPTMARSHATLPRKPTASAHGIVMHSATTADAVARHAGELTQRFSPGPAGQP